jgi:hypothetical protein
MTFTLSNSASGPGDRSRWIKKIVRSASEAMDLDPQTRWFARGAPGQSSATTFAWRCVLAAANELKAAVPDKAMDFCAAVGSDPVARGELVRQLLPDTSEVEHCKISVLVDFALFDRCVNVENDPSPRTRVRVPRGKVRFTAESEMHVAHAAGWRGDYAWDFYKLLGVRSPLRLFLCRVLDKPRTRTLHPSGMDRLQQTIQEMMDTYREEYLRDEDEVIVVLLSDSGWDAAGVNASCTAVFSQATGWTAQWDLIWDGGERDPD